MVRFRRNGTALLKQDGPVLPAQKIGPRTTCPRRRRLRPGPCGSYASVDTSEHRAGGLERFKVEHRPGHPLDGESILLDNVVEVFNLGHKDRHVAAGVDRVHRGFVGTALVHCDLIRIADRSHGLVEEALSCADIASRSAGSRQSCPACRRRSRGISRHP
jgi:hypothetical protein